MHNWIVDSHIELLFQQNNLYHHLHVDDQLVFLQDAVPVVPEPEHEADSRTFHDLVTKVLVLYQT